MQIPQSKAAQVISDAATSFGATTADIVGKDRRFDRRSTSARWLAIRRLRAECPFASFSEIGRKIGVNHATVIYALTTDRQPRPAEPYQKPRPRGKKIEVAHV